MIAETAGRADVKPVAHETLGAGGGGVRFVDTTFPRWAAVGVRVSPERQRA